MSAKEIPTPLSRCHFSTEIHPFAEPSEMEKTLLKLLDDLKFVHWEVVEEHQAHIAVTLGIEETEENIERIHRFIAAGRSHQRIKQLDIHRENRQLQSKGITEFQMLRFRSARTSLAFDAPESSYTKIVLYASDFNFAKPKTGEWA